MVRAVHDPVKETTFILRLPAVRLEFRHPAITCVKGQSRPTAGRTRSRRAQWPCRCHQVTIGLT